MTTAGFDRGAALDRLAAETFDVLVVGGGITGAGVALDAASRGLRTALVERDDFASGTSSKSSKLVHGGLRYLQQREFRLVYEALAERQLLRKLAPHLVELLPFLVPHFGSKTFAKAMNTALWMYDLTGGARIGKLHKKISRDETIAHMPTLRVDRLAAGFLYYDAWADDARLTLTIARTAALDWGAVVVNHAGVRGLLHDGEGGRVSGALVAADGAEIEVRARTVVNATGVWADDVRALDEGTHPRSLRPAKGVHLAVPWDKVRNDIAAVLPVKRDKRSIFVVPWGDRTYIGTTDTDYDGPLENPVCTAEDVAYLLDAVNAVLTEPVSEADVLGTWAGLRPLVRGAGSERTADLSRRHKVTPSASGLVTVTGGKLTTYRRMAADTVDAVVERVGRGGRSRTAKVPLRGADVDEVRAPGAAGRLGVDDATLAHLAGRYGGEARALAAMVAADPDLGRPLVPTLPYLRAEAVYAARYEMAGSVDDVLSRRTRARLLAAEQAAAAAGDVARLLAPELGWSDADVEREASSFRSAVAAERDAAGLPAGEVVA